MLRPDQRATAPREGRPRPAVATFTKVASYSGMRRMARHFTQSPKFRDFNINEIETEDEAFLLLTEFFFGSRDNFACPRCKLVGKHYLRAARKQWRCRHCHSCFSPTSGTPFHNRKITCKQLIQAIFIFTTAATGKGANEASVMLGLDQRTVWLLHRKVDEALVLTWNTEPLEGVVQADGGHFCGKPHRANRRKPHESMAINTKLRGRKAAIDPTIRRARMEPWNAEKLKNRRVALVVRQLSDKPKQGAVRTIVSILNKESAAEVVPLMRRIVAPTARLMTDSGSAFTSLAAYFEIDTVNHSKEYCRYDGVNNNQAESYISRLRRAEYGAFRGMRRRYLLDYCIEMAWREDNRRLTAKEKLQDIFSRLRRCGPSPSFARYYQGNRRQGEWLECPPPGSMTPRVSR